MTKKSHFDVLVIGSPSVDIVFSGMPHWPVLGQEIYVDNFAVSAGAVFNTAATLSRLGLRVAMLCELGNDFFSRYILEEIEKAEISRDLIMVRDQAAFSVSVCLTHESERGFVSYSHLQSGMTARMTERLSSTVEDDGKGGASGYLRHHPHTLLDSYDFDAVFAYAYPAMLPLATFIAGRGTRLFFDTGWHLRDLSDPLMTAVMRHGNFIMPNLLEAASMTGAETAEEAVRILAEWVPTAIVKRGAQGVVACQRGEVTYAPAFPVKEVVDTTGAGDAFNGGFIYGVLKGYSLGDALRCGTICGSLSTTALTGTAAVPTAKELEGLRLSEMI